MYECVMSHTWMSHVTKLIYKCDFACGFTGSHMWMSHVTRMNESYHTYEWVISHIQMSHVTRTNESCHTYEWVMSHIWMRHVTRTNESCPTYEWVMSHSRYTRATLRADLRAHIHEWVMSHVWMSISHIWMRHVTHMNESYHTYDWVMSRSWMSHITRMNESCYTVDIQVRLCVRIYWLVCDCGVAWGNLWVEWSKGVGCRIRLGRLKSVGVGWYNIRFRLWRRTKQFVGRRFSRSKLED